MEEAGACDVTDVCRQRQFTVDDNTEMAMADTVRWMYTGARQEYRNSVELL